jgi:CDGSH-type Zn-finger protein
MRALYPIANSRYRARMRREGTNPENVQMEDVLCDFCRCHWSEEIPFIEGHHGSCVCGPCLTAAYRRVVTAKASDASPGYRCTMCLEERPDPCFESPTHAGSFICERCIKLAAGALVRDGESGWTRPS